MVGLHHGRFDVLKARGGNLNSDDEVIPGQDKPTCAAL